MLPFEVIAVLGILCIFFAIGTLRAVLAKRAVHRKTRVETKPAVASRVAETTK